MARLLALSALAALAVLGWLVLTSTPPGASESSRAESEGLTRRTGESAPVAAAEAGVADPRRPAPLRSGRGDVAAPRTAASPARAGAVRSERPLEIALLVLGDGVAQLSGVDVSVAAVEAWPNHFEPARPTESIGSRLGHTRAAPHVIVRTDADGRATVPWRGRPLEFSATAGDASVARTVGYAALAAHASTGEPIVLECRRSPRLRVRVLDADGIPVAGHEVRLVSDPMRRQPLMWAVTDSTGRASFEGWLRAIYADTSAQPRTYVVASYPTNDSIRGVPYAALIARADAAEQEIELRLPPTGALVVRWVARPGEPAAEERGATRFTANCMGAYGIHPRLETGMDEVRFDRVPLGKKFTIEARSESGHVVHADVQGPKSPGEVVDREVRSFGLWSTTARVVDSAGAPLARASVEVAWQSGVVSGTTDREGRITLPARVELLGLGYGSIWRARAGDRLYGAVRGPDGRTASRSLIDIGDVVLLEAEPLLSGQLVDTTGAPVAWTRARVVAMSTEGEGRSLSYPSRKRTIEWSFLTDGDGFFALVDVLDLRGSSHARRKIELRVVIDRPDVDPDAVTERFELGAEGLTVRAERH